MSAYRIEYVALWPIAGQPEAIPVHEDRKQFFEKFDELTNQLERLGVPKQLRPTVQVRKLDWSSWVSYGAGQNHGWFR